jgi:hypothetical protein
METFARYVAAMDGTVPERTRFVVVVIVLSTLLVVGSMPAVAKEAPTQAPSAPTAEAVRRAVIDVAALFPARLGDQPWQDFELRIGRDALNGLDPEDVEGRAEVEALLEATGASPDRLAIGSASRIGDDGLTVMLVFQVAGAEAASVRDVILPFIVAGLSLDGVAPREETDRIAAKDVLVLRPDEALGLPPFVVYAVGDSVWLVAGPDAVVAEALEGLP